MIHRHFDAAAINRVVNDPAVFPWVSLPGQEALDLTPAIEDRRNVLLMSEGGGVLFAHVEPGVYEAHTQFLPAYRGRGAIRATRAAVAWMFENTDAQVLVTMVPAGNRAAEGLVRCIGGRFVGEEPDAWPTAEGLVSVRLYRLSREDWEKTPCQ